MFIGVFARVDFSVRKRGQHKKAGRGRGEKRPTRPRRERQVEEPEAGRTVERQMSSFVNGVGASLRDRPRHQWSGRRVRDQAPETGSVNTIGWPVYGFPSGSPPDNHRARSAGKHISFFRSGSAQRAVFCS
jgi:hypothetical protein